MRTPDLARSMPRVPVRVAPATHSSAGAAWPVFTTGMRNNTSIQACGAGYFRLLVRNVGDREPILVGRPCLHDPGTIAGPAIILRSTLGDPVNERLIPWDFPSNRGVVRCSEPRTILEVKDVIQSRLDPQLAKPLLERIDAAARAVRTSAKSAEPKVAASLRSYRKQVRALSRKKIDEATAIALESLADDVEASLSHSAIGECSCPARETTPLQPFLKKKR